jgi:hypothetical protein
MSWNSPEDSGKRNLSVKQGSFANNLLILINMKRKILVEKGEGAKIAKLLKCTPEMVSYSLNFKKNSFLARKIRKTAVERGGIDTGELVQEKKGA